MRDTLRQPDGKIRTACKFCRQRKKKCSGEMPCSSCVNFNRDCCVYDRFIPSSTPTSARPKETTSSTISRTLSWADQHNNSINNSSGSSSSSSTVVQPTSPCFTSKVLLTKVLPVHEHISPPPLLLLQAAFAPLSLHQSSLSSASSSSNASSSIPPSAEENNHPKDMARSILSNSTPWNSSDSPLSTTTTTTESMKMIPQFLDRSWTTQDLSPILQESPLSSSSIQSSSSSSSSLLPLDQYTQTSSPSSQSDSLSSIELHSSLPSPILIENQTFHQLLYQGEKETQELLQDVDALLLHYGSA